MKRQQKITIKEGIVLAQNGDQDAMIALLKKYQPLVAKMVGVSMARGIKSEDLESIFILQMIIQLRKLDTSRLE